MRTCGYPDRSGSGVREYLYKVTDVFAHLNSAGTLNGTTNAVIMTSRTDTPEDKYDSILTAVLKAM